MLRSLAHEDQNLNLLAMVNNSVVVLDNGASTIKVGRSGVKGGSNELRIMPNAVVRSKGDKMTYFGHELARCKDYSALHYRLPFEKVCGNIGFT